MENTIEERHEKIQNAMLKKMVEIEAGLEIGFGFWEKNMIPTAIAAFKKLEGLKAEMVEILAEGMPMPTDEEYLELRREAWKRWGFDFDAMQQDAKNE